MKRTVRTIGILGIIYSVAQTGGGIYIAYLYQSLSGTGQVPPIGSIAGTGFYIAILAVISGLIGLISCIALLLLEEWGFILFYLYTLSVGLGSLIQLNSLIAQWFPFIILTLISIFLIFQEKRIFHSQALIPSPQTLQ